MKICSNCNQSYPDAGETCPVCGQRLVDTDAARINAAIVTEKYDQSGNKFGRFMKSVAKMTVRMAEILDKKYQ